MTQLLVIKSSITGAASITNRLIDQLVDRLRHDVPDLVVTVRDLDAAPVPHLSSATLGGIGRGEMGEGSAATRILSDTMVAELKAADMLVIGAPMYNFGIPSTLKSWFDHVLRAGVTFQYGADGSKGLVGPKPVVVVEARGGLYSEGPASVMDAQEPHLRGMLGFMGLGDVEFVRVERLALGPDFAQQAIQAAASRLAAIPLAPALAA